MQSSALNYRHLLYFWVVAKEGTITRAAARLGVTVQTISGQLALLERDFGTTLFAPEGRRLALPRPDESPSVTPIRYSCSASNCGKRSSTASASAVCA